MSSPAPPARLLLPVPPSSVSLPSPPSSVSLPAAPASRLAPALPSIRLSQCVAGAGDIRPAGQHQVLQIGAEGPGEAGADGVGALAERLDQQVGGAGDDVGVVAGAAGQGVAAGTALQRVRAVEPGQAVVAGAAGQAVAGGIAAQRVVAGAADRILDQRTGVTLVLHRVEDIAAGHGRRAELRQLPGGEHRPAARGEVDIHPAGIVRQVVGVAPTAVPEGEEDAVAARLALAGAVHRHLPGQRVPAIGRVARRGWRNRRRTSSAARRCRASCSSAARPIARSCSRWSGRRHRTGRS